MPLFIVKLLMFWYTKQEMKVRWGNTLSCSFQVGNGVNKGVFHGLYCLIFTLINLIRHLIILQLYIDKVCISHYLYIDCNLINN